MVGFSTLRWSVLAVGVLGLSACDETPQLGFLKNGSGEGGTSAAEREPVMVEREREAPEIFSKTESALWDGRPSLGGIWVAHPDVDEPQRVVMRNEINGKFVIGALFRRERDLPGPKLQVSSDAASELGMLAGAPVDLSVVALIREAVAVEPEVPEEAETAGEIETSTLDPVAELAAKAIEAAEAPGTKPIARPTAPTTKMTPAEVQPKPAAAAIAQPAPAAAPPATGLTRAFVQVGIFSSEENATTAADQLRSAGVIPTIKPFTSKDKSYWRVVAGPVATAADRRALLSKLVDLGYADAYPVAR